MKLPSSDHESGAAADRAGDPSGTLEPTAVVGEIALLDVRRLLNEWLEHEPGARAGHDPEELHQLRVTARRLDATLSLFKHHLPAALVRARKTTKALLRALGKTRDLDVQLQALSGYCTDLPEEERALLEPLKERLTRDRARAHAGMLRALDSEPTRRWVQTLAAASEQAPADTAAADPASVAAVLPQRVRRRFRRLRKAVRRLRDDSSMEDFHRVRRRAKQLRYALESGAVMYGKPADDMLKALRRMQSRLGAQQDAHMAGSRLIEIAADPASGLPSATLFLMGRLAEHHAHISADAPRTVARSWRKVRGRRWKALRSRLGQFERGTSRSDEAEVGAADSDPAPGATNPPLPTPEARPLNH